MRGQGGAGLPSARKWQALGRDPSLRVVIANGEEPEPGGLKDRWLTRQRPQLLLEGSRLAAVGGAADRVVFTDSPIGRLHHVRERTQDRYPWVHRVPTAGERLPLACHGADLVTGALLFLHLCHARLALQEMARVAGPGGEEVLDVVVAFPWPPAWLERQPGKPDAKRAGRVLARQH